MVYGHDLWAVFAYTTRRVATELAAGRLPAWEPHVLAGHPRLASMQAAVLYPPAWGAALLSDATFWNVVLAAHLVLAALFADLWLRRGLGLDRRAALAGAVVFALAGFPWMRIFAGHVHYVWAYPWAAAVLWRLERWLAGPSLRRAVLLGPTLVPMVLAGVPQLALATALAVAARLAHFVLAGGRGGRTERAKVAAGAAAALAVGSLLAAPQVLPALELAAESQRGSVADSRFVTSFSLPPENLIALIAPRFFGDGNEAPYWGRWNAWEVCGYVGVATLLLCVLGLTGTHRQGWLWAATALGALLVALGRYAPFFASFEAFVPGAAWFRGPGRYLYLFVLATVPLAALGAQRLVEAESEPGARDAARRTGLAGLLLALALGAAALGLRLAASGDAAWWRALLTSADAARRAQGAEALPVASLALREAALSVACGALARAALFGGALALLLRAVGGSRLRGGLAATLATAVLAVELLSFDRRFVVGREPRDLHWSAALRAVLERELAGPYRLTTVRNVDIADAGRARTAGLDHVGGYEPLQLARYAEAANAVRGAPRGFLTEIVTRHVPHPVLDMLGVRVWLAPASFEPPPGLRTVAWIGERLVLVSDRALPRAWLVPHALRIERPGRRLRFLRRGP